MSYTYKINRYTSISCKYNRFWRDDEEEHIIFFISSSGLDSIDVPSQQVRNYKPIPSNWYKLPSFWVAP